MAWRAETPCGAFGFGHCGWNGKLAAVTNANGFVAAYAYDVMDRLASDGGVTYTYDAAGNRMTKTENGETVIYTLDEGDRLASYGRARSPSAPQSVDESVSVPALATLRYRFQCREWSAATGLINFRMRWYDSEIGRWLSKDPIGLSGGLNLYAFCMDSPIGIIDPMGNDAYISGSSGHATMWVDEPGENGKVAIFDFGPATGGWNDYNRNLIYGKGKTVATRSNKKDSMGRYDVRIVTSEATDRAIIDCMEQYKKEDHDYSFLFNNCAQAVRAVLIRSGVDDIGWCVWPEGLVESIRNRGGSYEPYNVFSHNPYFCPLR